MRETIRDYIDAATRRNKEETGEEGFSLIELIIVVVIIAILAAIAIPIFLGIQQQAKDNAMKGIAGNAAASVAAGLAIDPPTVTAAGTLPAGVFKSPDASVSVDTVPAGGTLGLDNFCVTATPTATGTLVGAADATSGPGC